MSDREEWEMSGRRAGEEWEKSEIQKESNISLLHYKIFEFISIRILFDYSDCCALVKRLRQKKF